MTEQNIAIVGISGIPADYGGFETFVENWMLTTASPDAYAVYCEIKYKSYRDKSNVKRIFLPLKANGWQSIFFDALAILHSFFLNKSDVTFVLGVSGAWIFPIVKKVKPARHLIVNIDGLEWQRRKWSKVQRKILRRLEWLAVKYSDAVVVDNGALADYVRRAYNVEADIISYGHEHCSQSIELPKRAAKEYFLSICRIEPENNCDVILDAFSKTPDKHIVFVGNWENSEYSRRTREYYSRYSNIELIGPEYDASKLAELRSGCSAYVHGHSVGGTNPSLIEILRYGKPIIAHDNPFNKWALANEGLYFNGCDDLQVLLSKTNEYSEQWEVLLNTRYAWKLVVDAYEELQKKFIG